MALAVWIGPADHERPLGHLSQRGPDLLAGDQPPVADQAGPSGDVGQVGAGIGLGVPLAPVLGAGEDGWNEPILLLQCPVGDDGRAEQGEADVGDAARCPSLDVGLVEDNLFGQGGVTATQALWVVEAQPSARGQLALPSQEDLGLNVLLADAAPASQVGDKSR